jgi:hypothetical protein
MGFVLNAEGRAEKRANGFAGGVRELIDESGEVDGSHLGISSGPCRLRPL